MSETTMRTGLTYKVLNTGNGMYRIAAVIDATKVVHSGNLHFVGDVYATREEALAAFDQMLCEA